jgi:hypothetical protein
VVVEITVTGLVDVSAMAEVGVVSAELEVVEVDSLVVVELGRGADVGGSSLTVPITQYSSSGSSSGQLIPGFNVLRSSTEIPQLPEKLSHVEPLSAEVENAQSTPRHT